MGEITVSATFPNILKENLEAFKKHADEAIAVVRGEPGTLQYDWYLSEDRTRCVVKERYGDCEGLLAHLVNVGPLLGPLAALGGGLDLQVFGDLSPQAREAVGSGGAALYAFLAGK
ncbi:antibiotic biosynthesis monooxygenase [Streptomyces sp. NEAU-sy36]|nr:antibiotic biosynthesis monooxygenase [Streptomyces sp. NEAU-sy36]